MVYGIWIMENLKLSKCNIAVIFVIISFGLALAYYFLIEGTQQWFGVVTSYCKYI